MYPSYTTFAPLCSCPTLLLRKVLRLLLKVCLQKYLMLRV